MKVLPSGMVADLSGRLGGLVASKNKQGLFFRTYISANPPSSSNAKFVRLRYSQLAGTWRSLSPTVKAGWQAVCYSYDFVDNKGNHYTPSAFQVFMYCNLNAMHATTSTIVDPQLYQLLSNTDVMFSAFDLATNSINLTYMLGVDPDTSLMIAQSHYIPYAGANPSAPTVWIAQATFDDTLPLSLAGKLTQTYAGDIATDTTFILACWLVNFTTGQVSPTVNYLVLVS